MNELEIAMLGNIHEIMYSISEMG